MSISVNRLTEAVKSKHLLKLKSGCLRQSLPLTEVVGIHATSEALFQGSLLMFFGTKTSYSYYLNLGDLWLCFGLEDQSCEMSYFTDPMLP